MNITNLDAVRYGVDDIETSKRFWTDFGLKLTLDEGERLEFQAEDGSSVYIAPMADASLPAAVEGGSTLREAIFGVDSRAELDAVAAELSKDRDVVEDGDGCLHTTDPLGFAIGFRVRRSTPVTAPELKFNIPGRPDRINTRAQFYQSATPLELTHTVYMIDEPDAVVPFYTERLGFRVSDSYPGRGYFMRGGASRHHHNLFLLNVGGKRGFHHVAFELSNIHELFGGGLNMTRRGWETALGPGRHPISSCYFWYFHCPSGGAAEYDFDSDIVDENWQAEEFEQTPELFAEWCLAEGMQESLLFKGIQSSKTIEKE